MTQGQIGVPATPGLVRIVGRVDQARKTATIWRTLVKLPAADEFSHPSTLEVRSLAKLGEPGQAIDLLASVSGFKTKPKRNEQTGEWYPPGSQMVLSAVAG